ncbi:hypothetical protein F3Y22_tig00001644pilonHSYRG00611 [Hibiscus syriacus]|uniref:FAD/NAD(P)-binding domain-containing protein n=1 Tax=Hibiscus syriacus TaxID=106335 RepID=A0A6A3CU43_HIBSY|nr:hypothetical protein F3Y22_tig00001644pilonHSYRG00611 [Hibiscus syriacus]
MKSAMFRYTKLIKLSTATNSKSPIAKSLLQASLSHFSTATTPATALHRRLSHQASDPPSQMKTEGGGVRTGWAGCRLMKGLDPNLSVAEPIARIQPSISSAPGSYFFLANSTAVDTENHEVHCETVTDGTNTVDPWKFKISYDKLVIASGAQASTFGIHGVKEHAIFLREVHHAQEIRRKLLLNLMLSDVPGLLEEEKQRLLHCVVVGGPTGLSLVANEILSNFDDRLRRYAIKQLTKVPYGLLVWSTGVGPSPFVNSIGLPNLLVDGLVLMSGFEFLQCRIVSIGDCSGFLESTVPVEIGLGYPKELLPVCCYMIPLHRLNYIVSMVFYSNYAFHPKSGYKTRSCCRATRKYLANLLNKICKDGGGRANGAKDMIWGIRSSTSILGAWQLLADSRLLLI